MNKRNKVPIVDLCIAHVDCVNRTAPVVEYTTPYKMIRTTNVHNGFIDTDNVRFVTEETYKKWTRRLQPQKNDIILTREAPLGDVGKIRTDDNIFLGQRLYQFRPNPNKLNADYLLYSLLHSDLQGQIKGYGSGSTVEHMRLEDIPNLLISIPPIQEQRKIAAILSAHDDLIENNLRRIKILEEMAQNLYREWFVKFRFPGHEKARFVESPLGKVPEGWEVRNLLSVADVTYGYAFQSNQFNSDFNGKPVVRIRDVLQGTSNTFSSEKVGDKYLVENGDILVGMDGDFHMGFWVGGQAYLVQRVARFRPKEEIGKYHLFLALLEPINHFNATITGTTVAHLGDKHIKTIEIKWPCVQLINQLNSILDPILAEILNLRIKNNNLRQTRDLLLPKLISGEVDVSELDIKVPEEVV